MAYKIKIEPEAHQDIQEGIDWYNEQQPGLGRKFHSEVKAFFKKLKTYPRFQIRYDDVHCVPIKKYPYMIHYTIHEAEKVVNIRAVFNTHRDSKIWKDRK